MITLLLEMVGKLRLQGRRESCHPRWSRKKKVSWVARAGEGSRRGIPVVVIKDGAVEYRGTGKKLRQAKCRWTLDSDKSGPYNVMMCEVRTGEVNRSRGHSCGAFPLPFTYDL